MIRCNTFTTNNDVVTVTYTSTNNNNNHTERSNTITNSEMKGCKLGFQYIPTDAHTELIKSKLTCVDVQYAHDDYGRSNNSNTKNDAHSP